jgi:hypothetical protein
MNILVLDTVNKSIEALLEAAPAATQPDFTSHFADATALTFIEASNDGKLNGTTAVTIVAAPAVDTRRIVREIVIYNSDTAVVTLIVRLKNGANNRIIYKHTLAVGTSWIFSDGAVSTIIGGGGGIEEAPINGTPYVRKDAGWIPETGGGGATDHGALTGLADDDHPQYIKHSLSTAESDFLVGSGAGSFIKKTLAEIKTLLLSPSSVRVYYDANIDLTAETPKKLNFNQERWDTEAMHSTVANTSRLTCVTAGKYLIIGNASFVALSNTVYLQILLNNITLIGSSKGSTRLGTTLPVDLVVSTIYNLAVGDYVELIGYASSTISIISNPNYSPEFMMNRIG